MRKPGEDKIIDEAHAHEMRQLIKEQESIQKKGFFKMRNGGKLPDDYMEGIDIKDNAKKAFDIYKSGFEEDEFSKILTGQKNRAKYNYLVNKAMQQHNPKDYIVYNKYLAENAKGLNLKKRNEIAEKWIAENPDKLNIPTDKFGDYFNEDELPFFIDYNTIVNTSGTGSDPSAIGARTIAAGFDQGFSIDEDKYPIKYSKSEDGKESWIIGHKYGGKLPKYKGTLTSTNFLERESAIPMLDYGIPKKLPSLGIGSQELPEVQFQRRKAYIPDAMTSFKPNITGGIDNMQGVKLQGFDGNKDSDANDKKKEYITPRVNPSGLIASSLGNLGLSFLKNKEYNDLTANREKGKREALSALRPRLVNPQLINLSRDRDESRKRAAITEATEKLASGEARSASESRKIANAGRVIASRILGNEISKSREVQESTNAQLRNQAEQINADIMNNLNSQRAEILRQYNMSKPVNTIQSDLLKGTMSNLMNYSDKVGEQNNFNNMLALSQPDLDYYYEIPEGEKEWMYRMGFKSPRMKIRPRVKTES